MKVLVADPIAQEGIDLLRTRAEVDVRTGLSPSELRQVVADYDALVVRSETKVTADIIEAGRNLKIIARAGVGVDNVDVDAATKRGIWVVNAPMGNVNAAVEHTWALMLSMVRNVPQAYVSLRSGEWKRSKFVGVELKGKTLGVVGLGKIGLEVAKRAFAFEMHVLGSDPYPPAQDRAREMGVEVVTLEELLARSDIVTVHVPLLPETKGMIGKKELALVKPGARLLNVARGGVIDEQALVQAIDEGRVAGAAIDVFEQEPPPPDHPFLRHEKIVVTPHLGASTQEAQVNVAVDVAEQILAFMDGKKPRFAVNQVTS
jgi:D-3-phosphoglycerate dehydrogenase